MDKQSGYAPVNGLQMYYEIHGKGSPLVLIHGGGSTIDSNWTGVIAFLKNIYQVIAMELQAHGRTKDRDTPESFEQDADDVAALLQYLNIGRADLFGFSNGANTAMQVAIRHPQHVRRLVLASGFYKREGMFPGFFDMLQNSTFSDMPEYLKQAYRAVNPDEEGLLRMFEQDRGRMLRFQDWSPDTLRSIKVPVLVMQGDRDVMSPEHAVEMYRLFPNASLAILPGNHGSFIGEGLAMSQMVPIPTETESGAAVGVNFLARTITLVIEFLQKQGAEPDDPSSIGG